MSSCRRWLWIHMRKWVSFCKHYLKLKAVLTPLLPSQALLLYYNLLEEVKRVSESAQRLRNKLCRYNYYRLPDHLKSLQSAASSRRTKLLFLPSGMSKREKNQTRYDKRNETELSDEIEKLITEVEKAKKCLDHATPGGGRKREVGIKQ